MFKGLIRAEVMTFVDGTTKWWCQFSKGLGEKKIYTSKITVTMLDFSRERKDQPFLTWWLTWIQQHTFGKLEKNSNKESRRNYIWWKTEHYRETTISIMPESLSTAIKQKQIQPKITGQRELEVSQIFFPSSHWQRHNVEAFLLNLSLNSFGTKVFF